MSRFEVFNVYADHQQADHQVADDPDEIAFVCDHLWSYDGLQRRSFAARDLGQRATTVLVLHQQDGTMHTVWVHRLAGVDAGTAILTEDGESFLLRNQGSPHYYGPEAGVVPRDHVPQRART